MVRLCFFTLTLVFDTMCNLSPIKHVCLTEEFLFFLSSLPSSPSSESGSESSAGSSGSRGGSNRAVFNGKYRSSLGEYLELTTHSWVRVDTSYGVQANADDTQVSLTSCSSLGTVLG